MTTIVDCPTCTRKLNVPEDLLGRPVRCPDCGGTFEAGENAAAADQPPPSELPPPADVPPDEEAPRPPQPGTPYSLTASAPAPAVPAAGVSTGVRPCPVCAAELAANAVHCRFCGEDLAEEDDRPWEPQRRRGVRRDCEPHRGTLILVFGVLSLVLGLLGLPFGIAAWVMGHQDLKKISARTMDPEGRGLTLAGKICGMVGTLLQCFMLLLVIGEMVVIFGVFMPMSMKAKPLPVAPVPAKPAPPPVAPPPVPAPGPGGG
jgi:hypothetical protein